MIFFFFAGLWWELDEKVYIKCLQLCWPTHATFLCACICFPSVSLHFVLVLFVKFKKIIKHKDRNSHGRRLSPTIVLGFVPDSL